MVKSAKYGIIAAVDGSAESEIATRWAADEAVMRKVPITLMHVITPMTTSWPIPQLELSTAEWQKANAQHLIEKAQKTLLASIGKADGPTIHTEIKTSEVVTGLLDASTQALMVVVGSRGLGAASRALLGSVSSGLVHHSHCPVVVAHAGDTPGNDQLSPVVLGIDGSPASEAATALAFDEAARRRVDLIALHAWSDVGVFPILGMDWREYEDQGHEVLGERLAGWSGQYPDVRVQRKIVCDRPAQWLVDESHQAQLVVVGSHGRGGFPGRLLGSVSSAVAQAAKAPVMVVRG
ncbi:nucleotide-binding universal stress UspA family protein [Mycobacterium frederiksbergense]|uniref:Nucleotide-binding universal stress UspA family protein n=1 Tax=Mycolicibacterium frederiksbergense TaxID=117567 RepID=A0ABT6KTE4_9MYCO|nr:universal stress protein [Mycolicibacterium frederiksbergense]MDH6193991.1 nucleotide-binding universal stress UspA family protein [Mycolicibacterium frederiksbergense]